MRTYLVCPDSKEKRWEAKALMEKGVLTVDAGEEGAAEDAKAAAAVSEFLSGAKRARDESEA